MGAPLAPRDNVNRFHTEYLENGDIFYTMENCSHPDAPEGKNGTVRMYHDIKAYIRKIPNFANTWHLVEIAHDDMNGMVPSWFVNSVYADSCHKEVQ